MDPRIRTRNFQHSSSHLDLVFTCVSFLFPIPFFSFLLHQQAQRRPLKFPKPFIFSNNTLISDPKSSTSGSNLHSTSHNHLIPTKQNQLKMSLNQANNRFISSYTSYSPLSWTTGYRATRPFSPLLHNPQYPNFLTTHPFFPHFIPPPCALQTPLQPTPFYLTQLHLSRPPTIPNPFPHPSPSTPHSLCRTLLSKLASYFLHFCSAVLFLWSTIPLAIFYILAMLRPYYRGLGRRMREIDWMAMGIAFVVFVFLRRGERGKGSGVGEGMVIGNGSGEGGMGGWGWNRRT